MATPKSKNTGRVKIDAIPPREQALDLAIKAVFRGHASPAQQRAAMGFILGNLCGISTFTPAGLSEREGAFVDGKQWVGIALARIGGIVLWSPEETETDEHATE